MFKALRRSGTVVVVLIAIGALAWLAAGCSGADDTAASTSSTGGSTVTTVPAPGGPTQTTTSGESQRVIVGGKTVEEYAAALPDLEKAVTSNPNDLAALQELAIAQYNTEKYEAAAATYQKMLQLKDDAFTRNNYGNVLRDWKKTDEAKAEYRKAISADPTLAVAYVNLVSILATEKNLTEANKILDQGIAATTGDDQARLKNYKEQLNTPTTTT
jgi:tetratricopeptide (TPR) repeat protein